MNARPSSSMAMSPAAEACARTIGLAPASRIGGAQRAEQRAIDQQRMTVRDPDCRADDRRVGPMVGVDDRANRRRRHSGTSTSVTSVALQHRDDRAHRVRRAATTVVR